MLPTMYNSYYQIIQSPTAVIVLVEMVHDARIIRIGGKHLPKSITKWMGDSVGHWEGDTLVVETVNFRPEQSFRGTSPNAVITERFTRVDRDTIKYQFTVEDPVRTRPYTGELFLVRTSDRIFEYACHEGNYAMEGMLRAGRLRDAQAGKNTE